MEPNRRESIVARLLTGELDEDDPEARAAIARDPGILDEVASLRATESEVLGVAAEEREDIERARRLDSAPGLDRIDELVRGHVQRSRPQVPGRRTTWLMSLVAAAALFALWLWQGRGDGGTGNGLPPTLGEPERGQLLPSGDVRSYGPLRWNLELPPGGEFEVQVYDSNDRIIARSPRTVAGAWDPGPAAADWPAAIRWEVHVHSPDGSDTPHEAHLRRR